MIFCILSFLLKSFENKLKKLKKNIFHENIENIEKKGKRIIKVKIN